MESNLTAFIFGLASAFTWGAGDFSGGYASKKSSTYTVVLVSQIVGGALLFGLALLFREPMTTWTNMLIGGVAGVAGMIGILALYAGLAQGRMGVVAPLTAVISAALPIIISAFTEGLPSLTTLTGFGMALVAVWFLSAGGNQGKITRQELILAVIAGVGFSLFFILIDRVSDNAVFWPLVGARVASVSVIFLYVVIRGVGKRPSSSQLPIIALAGILDAGGNAFFALAAQAGRLDVAAVLASLYPASTVMLAWFILKERLERFQWVGVVAALVALILISL
ncbi:MAG: DMT family transporter [Chloroflexi bacterium]|nr:MAG: DMT family transporter [Chloroflexota bacterium]